MINFVPLDICINKYFLNAYDSTEKKILMHILKTAGFHLGFLKHNSIVYEQGKKIG